MKYTPWFSGVEVPERVGAYERMFHNMTFFSYWDGREWWPGDSDPDGAVRQYLRYLEVGRPRWCNQLWSWRGVLK